MENYIVTIIDQHQAKEFCDLTGCDKILIDAWEKYGRQTCFTTGRYTYASKNYFKTQIEDEYSRYYNWEIISFEEFKELCLNKQEKITISVTSTTTKVRITATIDGVKKVAEANCQEGEEFNYIRLRDLAIKKLFPNYIKKELRGLHSLSHYGVLGTPTGTEDIKGEEIQVGDIVCVEGDEDQEGIVVSCKENRKIVYRIFGRFQLKNLKNLIITQKWNNLTQEQCEASLLTLKDYDDRYWED
jgi:hypothetical protein